MPEREDRPRRVDRAAQVRARQGIGQTETERDHRGVLGRIPGGGRIELRPGQGEDSGVHAVMIREGRFDGGYDPRREGRAVAEPAPR